MNCPPDDLQCSDAFVLVNASGPWLDACTEPLLICKNELLMLVIIIMRVMREVKIGILYPMLKAFNSGLIGTRRYYGGGPSSCDSQLQEK